MTTIDLRSDTVTKPSQAMRAAMAAAEVGDDVFGDDPTVNRLQDVAAELLGKEAALYVPSGTMANLASLLTHTKPGDEIILGDQSHILVYEVAGAARIANVMTRTVKNTPGGGLDPEDFKNLFRERGLHTPQTSLLCLENTHNRCGGGVLSADDISALAKVAHDNGAAVHLDGARIFNAQVALETPAAEIARDCDSVSFCLSKGLGCPVGSLICGTRDFVEEARRNRKILGGGMRQVGVLAAAGLYALENNVRRLAEDHANAKRLAQGLRRIGPFRTNEPESNIVMVDLAEGTSSEWAPALAAEGVLATVMSNTRLRMVTNLGVSEADIDEALERIERVCSQSAN